MRVSTLVRPWVTCLPVATSSLGKVWNFMWQFSYVQISVCLASYHSQHHAPGGVRGKQRLRDQRGALGLGHVPPPPTCSPLPAAALLGGEWRGRLLGLPPGYRIL